VNFMQLCLSLAGVAIMAAAQQKADSDVITFTNGDELSGRFVRSTGSSVTFKSEALGEITVDWSKVKELDTSAPVAVIRKGVKLKRHQITPDVPQGVMTVQDQKIQIGAPAQSISVGDTSNILDQAAFQKAITRNAGFFHDWTGSITTGATLVQATQENRTANGALTLVRTEPTEAWLHPRDRTALDFSMTYGQLTQPATPSIKTSIFHGDVQRDEYFTPSLFAFGEGAFDHNFSQGLYLQQTYAGGLGWTAVSTAAQLLDLKVSASYIRQDFQTGPDQNLIGSVFAEHYNRKLPRGMVLDQKLSATPAWNETEAFSAAFSALLTVPMYKRLSGSAGVIDSYLNNPPPGFRKNSFQFTLGVTYALP